MENLLALSGLILAGVLSPGPNNILVMTRAVHGGLRAAFGLMTGIVLGTLGLVLFCWSGAGLLFDELPLLRPLLRGAGSCYLIWLGLQLILPDHKTPQGLTASRPKPARQGCGRQVTGFALFCFQFLNPKAWVLVLTVVAAQSWGQNNSWVLAQLLLLFALLSGFCLLIWALAGQLLSRWLGQGRRQVYFDRTMGGIVMSSALGLLFWG